MGKIELDKKITGAMPSWGSNFDSMTGCSHDTGSDKLDKKLTSKDNTLNIMSEMDASHAKPSTDNPGMDKGFWAKAKPSSDTTGHGTLTRKLKD